MTLKTDVPYQGQIQKPNRRRGGGHIIESRTEKRNGMVGVSPSHKRGPGPSTDEIFKNCIKMMASGVLLECVSNNFYVNSIAVGVKLKRTFLLKAVSANHRSKFTALSPAMVTAAR